MTPPENSIPYGYCRCCNQAIALDKITIPIPADPLIRHIPLDKGQYAIVDVEDFMRLSMHKWHCSWSPTAKTFYARTSQIRQNKKHEYKGAILLHRMILGVNDPTILVDHENHNGLDCRKFNLRECTTQRNASNARRRRNLSGFKGVSAVVTGGPRPWRASITFNYKMQHIGVYEQKEDAARAYDQRAIELFGEFAHLNFPRSDYQDVLLTTRTLPD